MGTTLFGIITVTTRANFMAGGAPGEKWHQIENDSVAQCLWSAAYPAGTYVKANIKAFSNIWLLNIVS